MRSEKILESARFKKDLEGAGWQQVALPHTWNAQDGQDGGGDYWRGTGVYEIELPAATVGKRQFVEFEGANHIAKVYCNGALLGSHEGGFSTFRFELTDAMKAGKNQLRVEVYNGDSHVYPQQADFTFYGGLYRAVKYIEVEPSHFALTKNGSTGVFVTPDASGGLRVDAFVTQPGGHTVRLVVTAPEDGAVLRAEADAAEQTTLEGRVESPRLWQGLDDPALYTARLQLLAGGKVVDAVEVEFGFRSFAVDANTGFTLNGRPYPLHGVSRHQDRQDMGWAIGPREHEEDLALIREVGANTIRLAHYQHAQYFYSLCDAAGMILWAEIPFISVFDPSPKARENTISQMTELVAQNYNHPSVFFWGISNEISIGGESEELLENLQELHNLCKKLDPSRLTTMAQMTILPMESPQNQITDILSYNHYFGWYMGDVGENGSWLDAFHKMHPTRALGLSEYGSEGVLKWHSASPEVKDYTEEYQAVYHEEMLKTFAARPWLWSTHVWNMFDFAADARDEGGVQGRNNKGLVTYDRTIRKDAFYAYKAWWASDAFVHVCGRRFVNRAPGQRDVKVYSNCGAVTLLLNGAEIATLEGDRVFVFPEIALRPGKNEVTARAGEGVEDSITLVGVESPDEGYVLPDNSGDGIVGNWFEGIAAEGEMEFPKGRYSVKDTIGALMENEQAAAVLQELFAKMSEGKKGMAASLGNMMGMLGAMRLDQLMQMAGKIPDTVKLYVNQNLNRIEKPQG